MNNRLISQAGRKQFHVMHGAHSDAGCDNRSCIKTNNSQLSLLHCVPIKRPTLSLFLSLPNVNRISADRTNDRAFPTRFCFSVCCL